MLTQEAIFIATINRIKGTSLVIKTRPFNILKKYRGSKIPSPVRRRETTDRMWGLLGGLRCGQNPPFSARP